jgi:hypothetical protein
MDTLKAKLSNVVIKKKFRVSFDDDAKKAGDTHTVTGVFDFSDTTVEDALDPAVKKLVIVAQAQLRDMFLTAEQMKESIDKEYNYNVAKLIEPPKREYDPLKAGSKALDNMTPEQLAEFIKAAQKRAKKVSA